jgi:hypothetical protein
MAASGEGRRTPMRLVPRGCPNEVGGWYRWGNAVILWCPVCSQKARLNHTVHDQGVVEPSVECPRGCGFHETIRLDMWEPPESAERKAE